MNLCCCGSESSGSSGILPDCFCNPIPSPLTMTSADPTCNYGMFQSCTISYQSVPAGYSELSLPAMAFLSNESFADVLAGGAMFQYYLTCLYNQFNLTRIYLDSPFGSPFRDGVLYTWIVGAYGNMCNPFHLDNGMAFPGSDASCSVTIDAS